MFPLWGDRTFYTVWDVSASSSRRIPRVTCALKWSASGHKRRAGMRSVGKIPALWGLRPLVHRRGHGNTAQPVFVREGGQEASSPHSVELQFHAIIDTPFFVRAVPAPQTTKREGSGLRQTPPLFHPPASAALAPRLPLRGLESSRTKITAAQRNAIIAEQFQSPTGIN